MNIPITYLDDEQGDSLTPPSFNAGEGALDLDDLRAAQVRWAATPLKERLRAIDTVRHALAERSAELVGALSPRTETQAAEILSAQIIPLAEAAKFLRREATDILRTRPLPGGTTPLWLRGTRAEIRRAPFGVVLVVAPSNYPVFLPGVVMLQALGAGNAVVLKPGAGGSAAAKVLVELLADSGVPPELVRLLDEHERSVRAALAAGVDKVVFTGSAETGRKLLRACADHLVPTTMELSGCDAMFVRADADVPMAARALNFGLRLNRGATCIAPRRVFVHESRAAEFEAECAKVFAAEEPWAIPAPSHLAPLIIEAATAGARILAGELDHHGVVTAPLLMTEATAAMRLLRVDHFGPVAAIVRVRSDEEALEFNHRCRYALGASIFSCDEEAARALAARLDVGSIVINDVIVPTADSRLPCGGRQESGFGVTRGAEGLLELTVPKVVITRRGTWRPHFETPCAENAQLFAEFLSFNHARNWTTRLRAALKLWRVAMKRRQS